MEAHPSSAKAVTIEKHKDGSITYTVLKSEQTREYTVYASYRPFNIFDLICLITTAYLIWIVYYKHAGFVFLGWFLMKRRQVRRESIMAIRDLGVQIKTVYWDGSAVTRFIDILKIEDIIIHEGISFWQIKSYIAIIIKDEDKMVIVYENLLPKLDPILLETYRGVRSIIFPFEKDLFAK
ncbi:unnamed protein product [Rhizopus microsporus]|nr:hypothetical protein RMCBS344292_05768 [Rhizopus microsporus]